ncbi:MAG TPA: hypothetical protein VFV38_28175 [Ktedonobacteraceae bacterium]|nr:hypothetical protein [Ktedonobacteraceae bacterium]
MLISQKHLRYILGILWLADAIFQVQPQMFTTNMINSVLLPTLSAQPAPIAASLHAIVTMITQHLVFFNLLIAVVQAEIGLFLLAGLWVRGTVIISIVWSLIVWYGGEGMNMLLTGQASVLMGAPGAVLFYPLLGLLLYPRSAASPEESVIPRERFRLVLAGFWIFAALLQLQPFWWQPGQISQAIHEMTGLGGLNSLFVDPALVPLIRLTAPIEVPLNSALIVIFLGLGVGLALARPAQLRPLLVVSILLSILIWAGVQAFGMIFTGLATDFNSGLLILCMTLACWPKAHAPLRNAVPNQPVSDKKQPESAVQLANPAVS